MIKGIHAGFTLTTFLAVWGAILSSVTFGWNLLRDLRDRAKVRLTASLKVLLPYPNGSVVGVHPGLLDSTQREKLQVVISVSNVGRRPLRWCGLGGHYKKPVNGKERFIITARHLPRTLAEAEAHDEHADLDAAIISGNIESLFIWDSFDRTWKLPRKQLRRLLKDASTYGAKP